MNEPLSLRPRGLIVIIFACIFVGFALGWLAGAI